MNMFEEAGFMRIDQKMDFLQHRPEHSRFLFQLFTAWHIVGT